MLGFAMVDVLDRRVVAEGDDLDPLQPHDAPGLGPAAIVADAHAHEGAVVTHDGPAEVADLEVAFLQMLERPPWLVFGVAGRWILR